MPQPNVYPRYTLPTQWRGRTDGGIPYRVISRSGTFNQEFSEAEEVYLLRAVDLVPFMVESFPPSDDTIGIKKNENRLMPGTPNLRTVSIDWKSHNEDKPVDPFIVDPFAPEPTYHPVVEVQISYSNEQEKKDEDDPETYLTIRGTSSGEYLNVPVTGGSWTPESASQGQAGGVEPNVNATVIVSEVEWTVTWETIPREFFRNVLINRLRAAQGKVNSDTLSFLFNAPPGTLLLVGWDYDETQTRAISDWKADKQEILDQLENGEITQEQAAIALEQLDDELPDIELPDYVTISVKVLEKHIKDDTGFFVFGHNHYWRPNYGWVYLRRSDGSFMYESTNFANIFKAEVLETETLVR